MYPINQRINFLNLDVPMSNADVVVSPIPYDSTVSYRPGARYGPGAILSASDELEFFDKELLTRINEEVAIRTEDPMPQDVSSPKEMVKRVKAKVDQLLSMDKFVVTLGGEHTVSVGAIQSYSKRFPDLSVLQIDAHPDLRDEYEGSKYSHACTMRRVRDIVSNVVQVGNRTMSLEEYNYVKQNKLSDKIYGVDFSLEDVVNQLNDDVYITIDLDAFDPSEVPGVGTPVPGGFRWKQVLDLLKVVAKNKHVVGFDVVELSPIPGQVSSEMLASKLVYKLIGYSFLLSKSGGEKIGKD